MGAVIDDGRGQADMSSTPEGSNRRAWIIAAVGAIALLLFIQDILGWIGHGGVLSLAAAAHAANAKAASIDVDSNAFRGLWFTLSIAAVAVLGVAFDVPPDRRVFTIPFLLVAFLLGLALNDACGTRAISAFMTHRGYSRCAARDHDTGQGKGRIWFHNYVRSSATCPAKAVEPFQNPRAGR